MKRSFVFICTILTLSLFAFAEVKIGVINAQEIIAKTKKGQKIQTKLQSLGSAKQKEIDTKKKELEKLQRDLASPALNADTRTKKSREFEDKKIVFNRFVQDAQKTMQEKQQKEMLALYNEIMPLIQDIGKKRGFTLILDLANSGVAYFDQTIDVTAEVIKAVDAKYPGK
jgi:outer membrane protein